MSVDENGYIHILWHIDDVKRVAKDRGIEITDQEAIDILESAESDHDATIGVAWDTFDYYLDELEETR